LERQFLVVSFSGYCVVRPGHEYSQYDNTAPSHARSKPCIRKKLLTKKGKEIVNLGWKRSERKNEMKVKKKRTSNIERRTSNIEYGAASRAISLDPRSPVPRGQAYTCESRCGDDPSTSSAVAKAMSRQGLRRGRQAGAKRIKLTWGKWAIVDAEDYGRLSQYRWCAVEEGRNWYARTFRRDGWPLAMHRLILDAPKGLFVDHIDHNGLDNRRENLRLCTRLENLRNARPSRGGSSKYKGVNWCKIRKKFRARITHNKKRIYLGYFENEIDAAKAYDKKAVELFGEFAYLNFPDLATEVS
jgi:hypothetical protein